MDEVKPRYAVVEPTFAVQGGTPAEALEYILNARAEAGYRFVGTVPVRGASADGVVDSQAVTVMIFERRD